MSIIAGTMSQPFCTTSGSIPYSMLSFTTVGLRYPTKVGVSASSYVSAPNVTVLSINPPAAADCAARIKGECETDQAAKTFAPRLMYF